MLRVTAPALLAAVLLLPTDARAQQGAPGNSGNAPFCCRTGRSGMTFLKELQSAPFADDPRVLFHTPSRFAPSKPFTYLIWFQAPGGPVGPKLREQRIMEQVDDSGANLILVAPQMSKTPGDRSPGRLSSPGAFGRLMAEAAEALGREKGLESAAAQLASAPIILAAHREGAEAAAAVLDRGELEDRVAGVVLLAPASGTTAPLIAWASRNAAKAFLAVLYTVDAESSMMEMAARLKSSGAPVREAGPLEFKPGVLAFSKVDTAPEKVPLLGPPEGPFYSLFQ